MAMSEPEVRIECLSAEERLELLERIWDSLRRTPAVLTVSDGQKAELDRRSASLDQDLVRGGLPGVPWDEVLRQLRARR
jgi:putative addiction module component (TIGR02574 family)